LHKREEGAESKRNAAGEIHTAPKHKNQFLNQEFIFMKAGEIHTAPKHKNQFLNQEYNNGKM